VVTCWIVQLNRSKGSSCFSEEAKHEVYIDVFAFAFSFLAANISVTFLYQLHAHTSITLAHIEGIKLEA
jgi:hypothetical protein